MTMSGQPATDGGKLRNAARIIIVGSVAFTFISYWRTAAVVLCDLASTAYYIGGIVEQSIGPAAPWFILAVMIFSYAVRSVYLESCSLFVRGGVYRVVKEAMGGFLAKLSVSALMFDYILTGPISAVSAGQYIVGLILALIEYFTKTPVDQETKDLWKNLGAVVIATLITLYFFRQNLLGIHESSDKALKIMIATTVMAVVIGVWCGITLLVDGPRNAVPLRPDFNPHPNHSKIDPETKQPTLEDPTGFLPKIPVTAPVADELRHLSDPGANWLSLIGLLGICIAFGHSILAMSGEETLAQVYREVESPKMPNFKKAAFIVFVYSLLLTGGISFLAVMIIPNDVRMRDYGDNLIGGLAMSVVGPDELKLLLNAFVVIIGGLILAGAVNTAIIGSNGVLNRVAEDGVMPDWFLKPHRRYGTTHRVLLLILGLQLFTIIASRGDVLLLGEAYAFGVVWSFVFKAMAMVVLRFKHREPREFKVPLNPRIGGVEIPLGLVLIFLVLLTAAVVNLLTKETATVWGLGFTAAFLTVFMTSEYVHERKRAGAKHEHLEQFTQLGADQINAQALGLSRPHRKLVAIRSTQNLFMLEKALYESDPATTDVIVMTAKVIKGDVSYMDRSDLDPYDQELMTAVVQRAEKAGKQVHPLIVPTNNPLHAVLKTAKDLKVNELVMGASNIYSADEQLDLITLYWINLNDGQAAPLSVRLLGKDRDVHFDLGGGNRIPKIAERRARTVAELRAAGIGVKRVLLVPQENADSIDLFESVLTMLDPNVALGLVRPPQTLGSDGQYLFHLAEERSRQLGRSVAIHSVVGDFGPAVVRLARESGYDLIVLAPHENPPSRGALPLAPWMEFILRQAHCRVFIAATVALPETTAAE
jgi:amino acid transporter/nucleotide-binding universal stress UspA family protein